MREDKTVEDLQLRKTKSYTTIQRRATDFKKANESIGLWVIDGQLSLLSRKLYNVFVSAAQKQKHPGVKPPNDDPASARYFWIALQTVIKDTRYNSNDYETLKAHALELQNVKVAGESATTWTSERLLSGVKIYNSKGLRSKGGDVWLGFAFPPEVMQIILEPTLYTKFSLYYQTQLRTASSLALYEICRRYSSSPSHLTQKDDWTRWYYCITGSKSSEKVPEYKYFKRDHLMKSIVDINAITDIQVELLEFRDGRKVSFLQFKVYPKSSSEETVVPAPLINTALIARLVTLDFLIEEAEKIVSSYQEELVVAHLDLVEERLKNTHAARLGSAAAYFKNAIINGHARVKPTVTEPAATTKPAAEASGEADHSMVTSVSEPIRRYESLPAGEQQALFARFQNEADQSLRHYLKKGLAMTLVRKAFSNWLAENSNWTKSDGNQDAD